MPGAFVQYLGERFPVAPYLVLIGAMVAAASGAVAQSLGAPVALGYEQALVVLVLMLGFFHLRVFDEHKDYDKDVVAHPERVLSRGLITLADLRNAGIVAALLQLGLGAILGGHAVFWILAYMLFSVAMRYEFGVSDWLNRHIVVYAVSHNPIVALMMVVAIVVAADGAAQFDAPVLWWLAAATFTSLGFEVGRKVRAADDEKEGQDTYTDALGVPGAVGLVLVVEVLAVAATVPLVESTTGLAVLGGVGAVMLAGPLRFLASPTSKNAGLVETTTTLGALAIYLLVAIESASVWGVEWH